MQPLLLRRVVSRATRGCVASGFTPQLATLDKLSTLDKTVVVLQFSAQTGRQIEDQIDKLSALDPTPVSLKTMVETGQGKFLQKGEPANKKVLQVAQFIHREMPVRFAHRIKELDNLPYGLSEMDSIKTMRSWYAQGLQDLLSTPVPETQEDEREFYEVADLIYNRHNETLMQVAKGLFEFKSSGQAQVALEEH